MQEVYEKILLDLRFEKDMGTGLTNILKNMANSSEKYNVNKFLDLSSTQWLFMENIEAIFSLVQKTSLKMPMNFDRSLMQLIGSNNPLERWNQKDQDEIYNFFNFPNNDLNLMAVSHLYTMNDFGQFGRSDLFSFINEQRQQNKLSLGGVPESYQTCFKEIYHDTYTGTTKENFNRIFTQTTEQEQLFVVPSPCKNITQGHPCNTYCQWHQALFDLTIHNQKEFLTLMKLSQPQRKLLMPSFSNSELSLTKKVFGSTRGQKEKKSRNIASMPLVLFCKDSNDQDWLGDDIGLDTKFCSDFYPTPTDQGLCLTKNLNFVDLINISEDFSQSFDVNDQKSQILIHGDRINAKATFVIATNANKDLSTKTFSRSKKFKGMTSNNEIYEKKQEEMGQVIFQAHSTKELPQILQDSNQESNTDATTLKAGHEYNIELTPHGQKATSQFKSMDIENRLCFLSEEKPPMSNLRTYSKQNCIYECKVKYAIDHCGCIPWDFPLKLSDPIMECDVFGRTCFFHAIKQFIATGQTCPRCIEDCEFMRYDKTKIMESTINYQFFNPYSNPCNPKYFCDYLLDANNTIDPLTWYEEIKNFNDDIEGNKKKEFKKQTARKFLADHIVVHVNFATSKVEMNILDARWTLMDRIAKLGGTLGLCAQITGGTFLTMIHLLVLIIKACFNCWFKHQT